MPIKAKPLPTQALLRFFFMYDADTGVLTWKNAPHRNCPQYVGKPAGFVDVRDNKGVEVAVLGARYRAHRIIWKMLYDEEPTEIDHRDGNACNNRLINLRSANRNKNSQNTKSMRTYKYRGKLKGCYKPANKNFWVAQIKKDGTHYYLGSYKTEKEAHNVYMEKAKELFGDFANAGTR